MTQIKAEVKNKLCETLCLLCESLWKANEFSAD